MPTIFIRLKNNSETVYFQSIMGTYAHIAWVRTENPASGVMHVIHPPTWPEKRGPSSGSSERSWNSKKSWKTDRRSHSRTRAGMKDKRSLARSAGLIGSLTFLSRITGYARDVIMAYFFGATAFTDASG